MTRNETTLLPTVDGLKAQARRLRDTFAAEGRPITHSRSLEMLADQLGFRDWNTLRAAADRPKSNRTPMPVLPGDRVAGHYLGQLFTGEVLALGQMSDGAHFRVTLHFDEPIDVVKFDSFSSMRQRVSGTIDADGVSPQRTSNGEPQLRVSLI